MTLEARQKPSGGGLDARCSCTAWMCLTSSDGAGVHVQNEFQNILTALLPNDDSGNSLFVGRCWPTRLFHDSVG